MKENRKRPNYTKEFKQDAVKLVIEQRTAALRLADVLVLPVLPAGCGNTAKTSRIQAMAGLPAGILKPRTAGLKKKTSGLKWNAKY